MTVWHGESEFSILEQDTESLLASNAHWCPNVGIGSLLFKFGFSARCLGVSGLGLLHLSLQPCPVICRPLQYQLVNHYLFIWKCQRVWALSLSTTFEDISNFDFGTFNSYSVQMFLYPTCCWVMVFLVRQTCLHVTACYYVLDYLGSLFAQPTPGVLSRLEDSDLFCSWT